MAQAKGTVMLGSVKYLRSNKEEAGKILPDDLQHYLTERISPSAWYPEEDSVELIRAIVQLMPGHFDEVLDKLGIATAKLLGEGVYSHLISEPGSDSSVYALWASMHDSGKMSVTKEEDHVVIYRLAEYSHPCREMCGIVGSFLQETSRMGGRKITLSEVDCVLSGAAACSWRGTW